MLKINQLYFQYHKKQELFKDINFYTDSRLIGIVGKNGSGKSTLLKLISGELTPDRGEILVSGSVYRSIYDLDYYKIFTLEELLDLLGELDSFSLERLPFFLDGLNLRNFLAYPLRDLSQGTYKKIGLLFSFLSKSEIILLDEPFESLDPQSTKFVIEVINEFDRQLILVEHHIDLVNQLCQTVIDLDTW